MPECLEVIYPKQGKGDYAADEHELQTADICVILINNYTKILSRFCWDIFDTNKYSRKHRRILDLMSFNPNQQEVSFIWIQFQCVDRHP